MPYTDLTETTAVTDPTLTYFGDVTAKVTFDNLQVTTTEAAPENAILLHPETLDRILNSASGLVDVVTTKRKTIELRETTRICLKIVDQGGNSLTEQEIQYIVSTLSLPVTDPNYKLVELTAEVRNVLDMQQAALGQESVQDASPSSPTEQIEIDPDTEENEALCAVYDVCQGFIDENNITEPGGVQFEFNKESASKSLAQTYQAFKVAKERRLSNGETEESKLDTFSALDALSEATSKNLRYEKLIDDLAEVIGYAEPDVVEACDSRYNG